MVWAADRIVCCRFWVPGAIGAAAVARKAMVGPAGYGYRISPLCCIGWYAAVGGRNAEPGGSAVGVACAAMSVVRDDAKCAAV